MTTSEGIILIDTLFDYSVEEEVAGGLKSWGSIRPTIRYAVVTHPHPDHHGGAKFLQDRYKTRVVMSAADWDVIDRLGAGTVPARDMVATDGRAHAGRHDRDAVQDARPHAWHSLGRHFRARERHAAHRGALGRDRPQRRPGVLEAYIRSAQRFDDIARQAGADIILSNHTDWDGLKVNLPRLATRASGSPNPYVVGTPAVRRYLEVARECATARLMRVERAQARPADARAASGGGDWPTYNRDLAGTRYSPLTQINTKNVSTLVQAWSYRLRPEPGVSVPAIDKPASSFEIFQQVTPIVVNGVMYLPSGHRVVALEPETGKELWRYELPEGLASFRGVAYWPGDWRACPRASSSRA